MSKLGLAYDDLRTANDQIIYARASAFGPNGERLASGGEDKTISVWDAVGGKLLGTLKGHTSPVFSVAWSPDGKRLASCSGDKTVKVWNIVE